MPWAKGQSGNLGGRKKSALKELMDRYFISTTNCEKFLNLMLEIAFKGDVQMIKYLADREMGKIPEPRDDDDTTLVMLNLLRARLKARKEKQTDADASAESDDLD